MDPEIKKSVLRLFTYGMYAVTAQHAGESRVFLANWVSQCSFEPPLVMLSIQAESQTLRLIRASGYFAIQVLASGQRELAGMLGKSSATRPNKLDLVRWTASSLTGSPLLEDTLGYVECRFLRERPAGDSILAVGEVIDARWMNEVGLEPLTMQETGFHHSG